MRTLFTLIYLATMYSLFHFYFSGSTHEGLLVLLLTELCNRLNRTPKGDIKEKLYMAMYEVDDNTDQIFDLIKVPKKPFSFELSNCPFTTSNHENKPPGNHV